MLKKNNDNDNDKLQYLPRSLISQKYKKYSPAKYTLFLYLAVSIMFDAHFNHSEYFPKQVRSYI